MDKEISSLESQRDQELNAQQLIIDEKQKEEDQQQQIVDQINDEIEDLNTKLSNYGVSKDNLDIYNLLYGKKIYQAQLSDKKMIKFLELIAVLTDDVPDVQDYLFTENQIYYGTTQDGVIMDLIEIPLGEKEIKQFDKLKSKGILNVVNDISRLLKKMTLIDKRYFDLKDSLNVNSNKLNQAKKPLEKVIDQKENLINSYKEINIRFSNNIDKKTNIITNKHGRIFAIETEIEKRKTEIENLQREENITRIAEEFNKSAKTCKIGTQTWMNTNLSVTHFSNGDTILEVKNSSEWIEAIKSNTPAYCYPNFNKSNNPNCGLIYNGFVIMDARNIAPKGWRVPNSNDITILSNRFPSNQDNVKMQESIGLRSKTSWGSTEHYIHCSTCKDWTDKYRTNRRGCSRCKDTEIVGKKKVSMNGTNSKGFNCYYCGKIGWNGNYQVGDGLVGKSTAFWTSSLKGATGFTRKVEYTGLETFELNVQNYFLRSSISISLIPLDYKSINTPSSGLPIRLIKDD